MVSATLFAVWLMLGPPANTAEVALADLEHATSTLGSEHVDPSESVELLERSIKAATQEPRALLDDPRLGEQLYRARVALVWALLQVNDRDRAIEAMDEVVRSAGGRPFPEGFGPEVEDLYQVRAARVAHDPQAQLVVECKVPCEVLVNERPSGDLAGASEVLPRATYRVWVLPIIDDLAPLYKDVVLGSEGKRLVLRGKNVDDENPMTTRLTHLETRKLIDERKKIRRMKIAGGILVGLSALTLPVAITGVAWLSYANSSSCVSFDCLGYAFGGVAMTIGGAAGTMGFVVPGSIVLSIAAVKQKRLDRHVSLPTLTLTNRVAGIAWAVRF